MKNKAFTSIDLLVGILVLTAVFMLGMSTFKNSLNTPFNNSAKVKTIQEHIEDQVTEINNIKEQIDNFENEIKEEP